MCLHPEVQRKGQMELDELIAVTHSLPTFADRSRLHYISAIVEESLRWQIVAPLGEWFTGSRTRRVSKSWLISQVSLMFWLRTMSTMGISSQRALWSLATLGMSGYSTLFKLTDHLRYPRSILHDPQYMSEPSRFKPERYMKGGVFDQNASLSTSVGSFGFGRRCVFYQKYLLTRMRTHGHGMLTGSARANTLRGIHCSA